MEYLSNASMRERVECVCVCGQLELTQNSVMSSFRSSLMSSTCRTVLHIDKRSGRGVNALLLVTGNLRAAPLGLGNVGAGPCPCERLRWGCCGGSGLLILRVCRRVAVGSPSDGSRSRSDASHPPNLPTNLRVVHSAVAGDIQTIAQIMKSRYPNIDNEKEI